MNLCQGDGGRHKDSDHCVEEFLPLCQAQRPTGGGGWQPRGPCKGIRPLGGAGRGQLRAQSAAVKLSWPAGSDG